ncbi:PAS domain S-box protein [Nostoc piscinale]|uniref:PAS domain S-box protein n=1 Tax=Nostoc piscinale TaxID=224012 RepID=UPI0039A4D11B
MNIFIQIPLIPCNHSDAGQSMLLWLHIVSDSLIAIAYYSIPCTLLYFVCKRRDLPFNWIFLLFALLMLSCGTTHWIEIWTHWHPVYWLSGVMKAIASVISLYTALELIHLMPQALAFPSSVQLEATNKELEREISERQKIEAALRCSEERWHLAVAGTSEAIWDWDIATNQTYRSERWFEMLGYEHHELSCEDDEWSKRIHPDDYAQVMAAQTAYLLQQAPEYNVEYRLRRRDGSYGWFRSRAKAVWDQQGNPVRLVGSLAEITDRKQVELALQEREAMLRRIGDNLPNGAIYKVIRELDGSDRFYYLSAGIENIMEVSAADALQDSSLLYSQFISEDIPRLEAAENESKQHLSIFDIQLRICTPSGKLKWCHFRSSPRRLEDDRIAWDGMVVDVTELKRTEEILRKNEALLEEAQRVARLGNWEYDLATGKISWSKGLFELFQRDIQLSAPTYTENLQLYHPEDREKLDQAVKRAITTGESYKLVMRATRTDKVDIYVEGIGYAQLNANQEVIRLYGTAQDVTERIQAEEKLRCSEAQLTTTQHIAHVGSWEWNLDDEQQIWSTETFRIFGLSPIQPAPTQAEFLQMVHPNDRAILQAHFLAAIVDAVPINVEYRIIRPDGSMRYLESKAEVAYDTKRQQVKLFGAVIDITERKQAELEIIKSRDLREAIYNESADALFLVSPQTLLTIDCNYRAVELFAARCKADLIGIEGQTLHKRPFNSQEIADILAKMNQQGYWSQEIEYVTQQGNCFWGNTAVKKIQVAQQVMNLVRVTDISDRKQAEQALQEKENFLRSIYDGVAQAIFVVDVVDDDFRYAGLNPTHEELTGFCSDYIQGKTPEQLLPPTAAMKVRQHYQDCLNAGTTITYEECLPFKGQETWWFTSLTPLRDDHHRVYRIVGSCIDITKQKHAQQMLELQAVITRNMAEGICLVRASDGIIVYANPKFEKMFGYDTDELIGLHISTINYAEDQAQAEAVNQAISATVLQHGEASYEVHNVKKDGTPFWCSATTSMFEHPEYGKVFVVVHQDITEQKQVQEQLKASLKEKEVLLKEIHHRVKNNLGIVSSLLQMQCRRTKDTEATAILRDSQNRIASIALVHEKLYRSADLANIDFAQYIPDLTTHLFDSYNVTSNCIKLKIQVNNASLDIETAIPCGLIINELVSNALKYAFPHQSTGEITVSLEQQDNYNLILIIQDNGVGLPQNFDPKHTKTLGIILVQGLVKQLRGTIEVNSQQGTEFKITFTKSRA